MIRQINKEKKDEPSDPVIGHQQVHYPILRDIMDEILFPYVYEVNNEGVRLGRSSGR